ncbi:InlB B-repeat-containing protein [Eubacterium oxidoreducens]|uniref:Listeria/Bacterioides repeat-containing protein n=1 Tax=Eubacterium oxidoreducens TaxID=1732 RepID=A0A1G6BGJ6_EUBOX|nr:InlB B-repeat-containing protein [Eubacterium oxidoreducens]SDB19725.1 Listeria/Bacterioides repeat-containing protein [Eubacterium oxidoreducens]
MKGQIRKKILAFSLSAVVLLQVVPLESVEAEEVITLQTTPGSYSIENTYTGGNCEFDGLESSADGGDLVSFTVSPATDYYLAQVRLVQEQGVNNEVTYTVLEPDSQGVYSFEMPEGDVEIIADSISIVWDGTIDLTWYDAQEDTFELSYGAQLAGAAALVNGLFNDFPIQETETTIEGTSGYWPWLDEDGHPYGTDDSYYHVFHDTGTYSDNDNCDTTVVGDLNLITIKQGYKSSGVNLVQSTGVYWYSDIDFTDKTILLTCDINMGGVCSDFENKNDGTSWSGPNFMPIGGSFVSYVDNGCTRSSNTYNGNFDGQGHIIYNLYCSRHVNTYFGDCQGIGIIGECGCIDSSDSSKWRKLTIENLAIDGYINANRCVGGILGRNGVTTSTTVSNCINFARVEGTDAKGCGGIVGGGFSSIYVNNCANFGYISEEYNKGAGGIIGYSEGTTRNCYNLGYVAGLGTGNEDAASAIGMDYGGAYWYNNYYLKDSSTSESYPGIYASSLKGENANIIAGTEFCFAESSYDLANKVSGTGRCFAYSDEEKVSTNMADALKRVHSIGSELEALDATGIPIPRVFLVNAEVATATAITATGTPVTEYYEGQTFNDNDSFVVKVTYSDQTSEQVEDYTVTYQNGDYFKEGDTYVTVSYEVDGISFSQNITVTVHEDELDSLKLITSATNTLYCLGETFDTDGLIVRAYYISGRTEDLEVEDYSYSPMDSLSTEDEKITISYTYKNMTLSEDIWIDVLSTRAPNVHITSDTEERTVDIYQENDLLWFANQVSINRYPAENAELMNDITVTGEEAKFLPVGDQKAVSYEGTFDGNGYSITFEDEISDAVNRNAFIYSLSGTVENLTLKGSVSGGKYTAAFAACIDGGTITNCINEMSVSSTGNDVGGIAAVLRDGGKIIQCMNRGVVRSTGNYVGGIAGDVTGDGCEIKQCITTSASVVTGSAIVGGIAGRINSDQCLVTESLNFSKVNASCSSYDSSYSCGGIVGTLQNGSITKSVNKGEVASVCAMTGGVAGIASNSQTILECYNTATVSLTGTNNSPCIGGVAGMIATAKTGKTNIQNCYNTGTINLGSNTTSYHGALIGRGGGLDGVSGNYALALADTQLIVSSKTVSDANGKFWESTMDMQTVPAGTYVAIKTGVQKNAPLLLWQTESSWDEVYAELLAESENANELNDLAYLVRCHSTSAIDDSYQDKIQSMIETEQEALVQETIAAIDAIGTVTASSKQAIVQAANLYGSLSSDYTVEITNYDILENAMRQYKKITASYHITFQANDSTSAKATLSFTTLTVGYDKALSKLPTAKRSGYTFDGWYTKKSGGSKVSITTKITEDTTYYAHWTKVNVAKTKVKSIKSGKKKLTVRIKGVSGAAGYQICYSLKSSMKGYKTVTITGNKTVLNKLKAKKKYYIKVRAYKLDSKGNKVFGKWSVKKVKKTK